jgi:hypothetical protein
LKFILLHSSIYDFSEIDGLWTLSGRPVLVQREMSDYHHEKRTVTVVNIGALYLSAHRICRLGALVTAQNPLGTFIYSVYAIRGCRE